MRVAILTSLKEFNTSYSLVSVVQGQAEALVKYGHQVGLFVCEHLDPETWEWCRVSPANRFSLINAIPEIDGKFDGDLIAASEADGRCVFLGANGQCRVYPVRPVQCRTYPFWPEVLCSGTAWEQESRRCEGIGRGGVVPVTRIRAALARQRAHDAGLG